MKSIAELTVKIYADGADKKSMLEMLQDPFVKGFTTNPSLLYKAGVKNYQAYAREILNEIGDRPISFEVLCDDFSEMKDQAMQIASWGDNVYVKIPVTNTQGKSSLELIRQLAKAGVKLNVTAIMTREQVRDVANALVDCQTAIVSVFAGRVADTGTDPIPLMKEVANMLQVLPQVELLWASTREVLNIFQADAVGCHIITVTPDIIKKLNVVGKDLNVYSLETVKTFYDDAARAGLSL